MMVISCHGNRLGAARRQWRRRRWWWWWWWWGVPVRGVCCGRSHLRWRVDRLSTPERPAPRSPETPSASSAWRPTERFWTNPERWNASQTSIHSYTQRRGTEIFMLMKEITDKKNKKNWGYGRACRSWLSKPPDWWSSFEQYAKSTRTPSQHPAPDFTFNQTFT